MTTQTRETLSWGDIKFLFIYAHPERPIENYFKRSKKELPFGYTKSSLQRGYKGDWVIISGMLYLREIYYETNFLMPHDACELNAKQIFGAAPPIFAEWYSGTISLEIEKQKGSDYYGQIKNIATLNVNIKSGIIIDGTLKSNLSHKKSNSFWHKIKSLAY